MNDILSVLTMNGHGEFVWGAFGIVGAVLLAEVLTLASRRRALARASQGEADDASDEA